MPHLRWTYRPTLHRPVVIVAFEGWNDAGDAASGAVEWFVDRWDGRPFADIDPEEFFDFTSTRPEVRTDDDGSRVIDWPANTFHAATIPGTDRDVVLLLGVEPQLRWRTFCDEILHVVATYDSPLVVTLGALLADVAHSRPVRIVGTAESAEVSERLGLRPSTYEGPTGIVGVLRAACDQAGIPSASFWAAVPTYVPGAPSPKATLALVEHVADLLEVGVLTTDLEIASASYERQINELVDDDEDTAAYVAAIERRQDEDEPDDDLRFHEGDLAAEVERFLREQGT